VVQSVVSRTTRYRNFREQPWCAQAGDLHQAGHGLTGHGRIILGGASSRTGRLNPEQALRHPWLSCPSAWGRLVAEQPIEVQAGDRLPLVAMAPTEELSIPESPLMEA